MRVVAILQLLSVGAVCGAKKFGSHPFPHVTASGQQTANEFQMVNPENIVDGRKYSAVSYSLDGISPLVIKNDDIVTVKFSSSSPSNKDWIGAYSPADVDFTKTTPVKYGWCDDDNNYLSGNSGALTFNLTNLRADVAFYYFTNSTGHPILVASYADNVKFANDNEPLRPRVVATGDYDVLNLLWSSATSAQPTLLWGTSSGAYNSKVAAVTSSIPQSAMCGSPANTTGWRDLGLIHTAPFTGMKALANKKVYYKFGDDATNDYSKEYVLNVPPLAGTQPPSRPTTAILYDDLGRGSEDMTFTWYEYGRPAIYTLQRIGAEVASGAVDVIYHGGDISYATGFVAVWDFFLDLLSPVASAVVYLTTVGNHESDWYNTASMYSNSDSGGECGVLTTTLLPMPAPATTNKPWWSYKVGLMHFIGMSTEHDYTIGSEQYLWLEKDLQSIDRTATPWVIFGGHRAMYLNSDYNTSATSSDGYVSALMVKNIEPLLWKYRVNVGFYGHNHVVQRHSALLNFEVVQRSEEKVDAASGAKYFYHDDPQATVHMVVGTAGAAFTQTAIEPKPEWNEMYMYEYGYARVTAVNATYLDWEWVHSMSGEVWDHMVITQSTDFTQPWKI